MVTPYSTCFLSLSLSLSISLSSTCKFIVSSYRKWLKFHLADSIYRNFMSYTCISKHYFMCTKKIQVGSSGSCTICLRLYSPYCHSCRIVIRLVWELELLQGYTTSKGMIYHIKGFFMFNIN